MYLFLREPESLYCVDSGGGFSIWNINKLISSSVLPQKQGDIFQKKMMNAKDRQNCLIVEEEKERWVKTTEEMRRNPIEKAWEDRKPIGNKMSEKNKKTKNRKAKGKMRRIGLKLKREDEKGDWNEEEDEEYRN